MTQREEIDQLEEKVKELEERIYDHERRINLLEDAAGDKPRGRYGLAALLLGLGFTAAMWGDDVVAGFMRLFQ